MNAAWRVIRQVSFSFSAAFSHRSAVSVEGGAGEAQRKTLTPKTREMRRRTYQKMWGVGLGRAVLLVS